MSPNGAETDLDTVFAMRQTSPYEQTSCAADEPATGAWFATAASTARSIARDFGLTAPVWFRSPPRTAGVMSEVVCAEGPPTLVAVATAGRTRGDVAADLVAGLLEANDAALDGTAHDELRTAVFGILGLFDPEPAAHGNDRAGRTYSDWW